MQNAALTITQPLVLYRALLATKKIRPDPAQLRLALHLDKLYDKLKDYEPTVEYSQRLRKLSKAIASSPTAEANAPGLSRGLWQSILQEKERRDTLALTRVLSDHDEAMRLESPKGLMVHGEVGTGKSMLVDLFHDCLPTKKKRRWHYNTFIIETFAKLERLRVSRLARTGPSTEDHSLLWLARDLVEKSPVLFLDEFQLPDRAAAKIMSNLMTGFFSLGGVLIATSNRMPDELAKAAGLEFVAPAPKKSGWSFGRRTTGAPTAFHGSAGEYAQFLELLKGRCEIWEMEGKSDYRRSSEVDKTKDEESLDLSGIMPGSAPSTVETLLPTPNEEVGLPLKYFVNAPTSDLETEILKSGPSSNPLASPIPWTPTETKVYGRTLSIPRSHKGTAYFTFLEVCGKLLGPADYITLASTFHTFIITEVPVLTSLLKNEARRFITLLDALYEAKCKLLISAAADPDNLFFPELRAGAKGTAGDGESNEDATYAETFSEIYQDSTAPFRPNVSVYTDGDSGPDMTHSRMVGLDGNRLFDDGDSNMLAEDALEDDPPNKIKRMMGRTDSDFLLNEESLQVKRTPDFAKTGTFIGEDEKFAYKRATSRLFEMCSRAWWSRSEEGWWRPLPIESRGWEGDRAAARLSDIKSPAVAAAIAEMEVKEALEREGEGEGMGTIRDVNEKEDELMFKYPTSPFRDWSQPPPKHSEEHAWGLAKWGKKAGAWGKGVEGLKERKKKVGEGHA